jgi:sn-glycerol 3-phosphate transport system substrate-binding protein
MANHNLKPAQDGLSLKIPKPRKTPRLEFAPMLRAFAVRTPRSSHSKPPRDQRRTRGGLLGFPVMLGGLLGLTVAVLATASANSPSKITFWHYFGDAPSGTVLTALAEEFNKSQTKYEIDPQAVGSYKDLQVKTIAALRGGGLPTMAIVDNAFFTRLALGGQLEPLNGLIDALPKATVQDFYPTAWDYGDVKDQRLGLPWVASSLLVFYNANAFRAKGLNPPRTWDDFNKAARALSSRAAKGAIMLTDGWVFGSMVSSRGGNILSKDNKPDFTGSGALGTLQFLFDLSKAGALIPRTFSEINIGVIDFLRTKAFMVVLPSSAYQLTKPYAFAFEFGAVALPGKTLAGEAQTVVFKNAPPEAQRGAFEFWQYLTRPENIARFSKEAYYVPVRRSAVQLMGEFATTGIMKEAISGFERAYNPPHLIEYQDWRRALEDQLELSLKGGVEPAKALAEAQRQALNFK